MITRNDVRSRVGYNEIGDIRVRYEISQATGQPVASIRATIEQDEKRVGTVTMERDGRMYVSFDYANSVTYEVKQQVLAAILTDCEGVFNEPVVVG